MAGSDITADRLNEDELTYERILMTVTTGIGPDGRLLEPQDIKRLLKEFKDRYIITDEEYRWLMFKLRGSTGNG